MLRRGKWLGATPEHASALCFLVATAIRSVARLQLVLRSRVKKRRGRGRGRARREHPRLYVFRAFATRYAEPGPGGLLRPQRPGDELTPQGARACHRQLWLVAWQNPEPHSAPQSHPRRTPRYWRQGWEPPNIESLEAGRFELCDGKNCSPAHI